MDVQLINRDNKLVCQYTPDYPELVESRFKLFFFIDSMMVGCKNYQSIQEYTTYGCRAFTEEGFECYQEDLTGKVIPFYGQRRPNPVFEKKDFCRVKGEVHIVESTAIPVLDTIMRNRVQYVRRRVKLIVPYRDHWCVNNGILDESGKPLPPSLQGFKHYVSDEKVHLLEACMYVAKKDYWNPLVDGLSFNKVDILTSDRPWLLKYYQYKKRNE